MNLRVSSPGPSDLEWCSRRYLFLYQSVEDTNHIEKEIEPLKAFRGMCPYVVAMAFSHHGPVTTGVRGGASPKGFSPLKVVLGTISAVYANRKVRYQLP